MEVSTHTTNTHSEAKQPRAQVCPICCEKYTLSLALENPATWLIGYCENCLKHYFAGKIDYRPSWEHYTHLVAREHARNDAYEDAKATYYVARDNYKQALLTATVEELKPFLDTFTVAYASFKTALRETYVLWAIKEDFEDAVYKNFTSVNTPLPKHVMEFFSYE